MNTTRNRVNGGVLRMFFFLAVFCIGVLVVFITLGRTDKSPITITKPHDNINPQLSRLYPRSVDENNYKYLIIVFGWRRKESLERLVKSLLNSDYLGKNVQIQFHIEYEPSQEVKEYVNSVKWPFGTKMIIWREERYGLERMVVDSWDAKDDNEFAFFFEDDIEVHPLYFKFAIEALKKKEIIQNSSIVGVSLNTPRYDEVNLDHSIWITEDEIGSENNLFLFQQPCSWGALYFPWKWREYLEYYDKRRRGPFEANTAEGIKVIPNSYVFNWTRSWKKYYMEMMVLKGYVMIYPSLPTQGSLSIHHREEGEHTGIINKYLNPIVDYFVVPLVNDKEGQVLIDKMREVEIDRLPIVSFYHFLVKSIEDLKEFGLTVQRGK